jgi:hypothetical protein
MILAQTGGTAALPHTAAASAGDSRKGLLSRIFG